MNEAHDIADDMSRATVIKPALDLVIKSASALQAQQPSLSEIEALRRVFKADSDLYECYRKGPAPNVGVPATKGQPAATGFSEVIPHGTQTAIIKTAAALSPGDYRQGMAAIEAALDELRDLAPTLTA